MYTRSRLEKQVQPQSIVLETTGMLFKLTDQLQLFSSGLPVFSWFVSCVVGLFLDFDLPPTKMSLCMCYTLWFTVHVRLLLSSVLQ